MVEITKKKIKRKESEEPDADDVMSEAFEDDSGSGGVSEAASSLLGRAVSEWFSGPLGPGRFDKEWLRAEDLDGGAVLWYDASLKEGASPGRLRLCSASLKVAGASATEFVPADAGEDGRAVRRSELPPVGTLLIYGRTDDCEDFYRTRLDAEALRKIAPDDCRTNFKRVELRGSFRSAEEMREIIDALYDRLCDKSSGSCVGVWLESTVPDADGRPRSVADLVDSGYLAPQLASKPGVIDYVYKRLGNGAAASMWSAEAGKSNKLI